MSVFYAPKYVIYVAFDKNVNAGHLYISDNKKFELMLMRCARAYNTSCSHVILVYVHPLFLSSLFCSWKSQKNWLKPPIFVVQKHLRLSMLIPLKSTSPVLVMISSPSVLICKRFHAKQANSAKLTLFKGCLSFVERRRSGFGLLKSTFNAENFVHSALEI